MNIQSRGSRSRQPFRVCDAQVLTLHVTDQLIFCRACGRPIALKRAESPAVAEMADDIVASGYLSCDCGHVTPLPFTCEEDA